MQEDVPEGSTLTPWAQCDKCLKWRRIPWYVDPEQLPNYWVCADNEWDPERANCDVSCLFLSQYPTLSMIGLLVSFLSTFHSPEGLLLLPEFETILRIVVEAVEF